MESASATHSEGPSYARVAWWVTGLAAVGALVYLMATAHTESA
jgi:hypothetical protein